jgi:hypothetical protein
MNSSVGVFASFLRWDSLRESGGCTPVEREQGQKTKLSISSRSIACGVVTMSLEPEVTNIGRSMSYTWKVCERIIGLSSEGATG